MIGMCETNCACVDMAYVVCVCVDATVCVRPVWVCIDARVMYEIIPDTTCMNMHVHCVVVELIF